MATQRYKHDILLNFSSTLFTILGRYNCFLIFLMYSKSNVGQAKIPISYLSRSFHFSHCQLAPGKYVDVCATSSQPYNLRENPLWSGHYQDSTRWSPSKHLLAQRENPKPLPHLSDFPLLTATSLQSLFVLLSRLRVDQQVHWPSRCWPGNEMSTLQLPSVSRVKILLDFPSPLAWCCGNHSIPDDPGHSSTMPFSYFLIAWDWTGVLSVGWEYQINQTPQQ